MQTSSRSGPTASSARASKRKPTTLGGSKTSSNTPCWCGTRSGSLLALDLIVIVGFDGCFKRVNPAFERTLAYPLRTLVSRPFLEVIHPEDFAWPRSMFDEFGRDDRHDMIGVEHRVVCRDGSVPWFQLDSRVLPDGCVVFAVGPDVTERRRADAELRDAQRMVEASRAELARLAEEQAALRRVARLAARGVPPEEAFAAIAGEVERLLRVDVVNLCRYESDGAFTVLASAGNRFSFGRRRPRGGKNLGTLVFETGRPARIDNSDDATGPVADDIHESGVRSAVATPILVEGRLWGVICVGSTHEQPLLPDTETRLASFTDLAAAAISNTEARTEVAASQARIVAATDEERRRVVRDLHDGAQQRLVHTTVTLKMAKRALKNGQENAAALLSEALDNAERATAELRELAQGILPTALTQGGLRAGVAALASRVTVPVEIDIFVGRLPAAVEATAYFVVAEALTNVAKHARAGHADVMVRVEDGTLAVHVRDDGVGGARLGGGSGLIGLADRLAAVDGVLDLQSSADSGTFVAATIPLAG
jgi:PAS domain S-box-containing protein